MFRQGECSEARAQDQNQPAEENVDVKVPGEFIGLVIGRGGERLMRFEQQTQTKICLSSKQIENLREIGVFTITGSHENCQMAKTLITDIVDQNQPAEENVDVKVPGEFIGQVIGRGGERLKRFKQQTQTKICLSSKQIEDGREIGVFTITGSSENCHKAEDLIKEVVEKKIYNKSTIKVERDYAALVIGKHRASLHDIETKSGTKILIPSKEDQESCGCAIFTIIGPPENCERAKALIMESITSAKDYMLRKKLGGVQFAIVDHADENAHFSLKKDETDAPKLNGYMKGEWYRIQPESKSDDIGVFSETALSFVHDVLLETLQHLHQVKDEKELTIDLWCHLGKVFVHRVDEGEEIEGLNIDDVKQRLPKIVNNLKKVTPNGDLVSEHGNEDDDGWRVTFEEGIDPKYNTKLEQLAEDGQDQFLHHHHTRWRYDYAFTTPSGRNVRFKLWENLEDTTPPPEVKWLIKQVSVKDHQESVVAWLCYPSTGIVKGDIITPTSIYDCRLKLRTGRRFVPQENGGAEEENEILCEYLSKCTLRTTDGRRHLVLPEEPPEGFGCCFYRSAEEKIFKYTERDKETFTVTVLDEQGWDSDLSEKRHQKQFGIRVVLDSWSEELLSGEWEPGAIVNKLREFMEFFCTFRVILLGEQ